METRGIENAPITSSDGGRRHAIAVASLLLALASTLSFVAIAATLGPESAPAARQAAATLPTGGLYEVLDASWAGSSLWDDGKAELDLYSARLLRESSPRDDAYVVHIVVKEAFTPEYLVKADDWRQPDRFDVLKLNNVSHARTGLYDFDEMVSTFVERRRLVPVKMTYGRQEWCGNIFKEWRRWRDQRTLFVSSYFDGTGTQQLEHGLGDEVVPYDSLPVLLRALRFDELAEGRAVSFPLLPSLYGSRAEPVEAVEATMTGGAAETIDVPAGSFATRRVSIVQPGRRGAETTVYWIETAHPNRIVRVDGPGDERLELARSERLEYWRLSGDDTPWFPAPVAGRGVDVP